jgi:hypothetical protein
MELSVVGESDWFFVTQGLFLEGRRWLYIDTVERYSNSPIHHHLALYVVRGLYSV